MMTQQLFKNNDKEIMKRLCGLRIEVDGDLKGFNHGFVDKIDKILYVSPSTKVLLDDAESKDTVLKQIRFFDLVKHQQEYVEECIADFIRRGAVDISKK